MTITYTDPQGTPAWLDARRGVITGSRAKDCRDFLKNGNPSVKLDLYAKDVARERAGGQVEQPYQNGAMRFGTEQEPLARVAYETQTGRLVDEAGFICTDDRLFGASVDGLVDDDGIIEIKTMVSSATLFKAVVDQDHSDYIDQINFCLWLLRRQWCDLVLWAPDLPDGRLTIVRIERDEAAIGKLESDLMTFAKLAAKYESQLRQRMRPQAATQSTPAELPESIFN